MKKFETAPGLPGYGTKGSDGTPGTPGISFYFSSMSGEVERSTIANRIVNNLNLYNSGSPLPANRSYLVGDVFVDKNGKIFSITNPSIGDYGVSIGQINTTGLFVPIKLAESYERYANSYTSPKYIIDEVFINTVESDYTTKFNSYGITADKFAKIQYANIDQGPFTPFTTWYQGDGIHSGISLVKNSNIVSRVRGNTIFRLGNLDASSNTRNVELALDFRNVYISNKGTNAVLNPTSHSGSVITNAEIVTPHLFSPNFIEDPSSFRLVTNSSDVSIYWNKSDFLVTNNIGDLNSIRADLHFYRQLQPWSGTKVYDSSSFDFADSASLFNPLILPNLDVSGVVGIKALTPNVYYNAHIVFYQNGWPRSSKSKTTVGGIVPALSVTPTTLQTVAWDSSAISYNVSSNIAWSASGYASWITLNPANGSTGAGQTVTVNFSNNITTSSRSSSITFTSAAPTVTRAITQSVRPPIQVDASIYSEITSGANATTYYALERKYELRMYNNPAQVDCSVSVNWALQGQSSHVFSNGKATIIITDGSTTILSKVINAVNTGMLNISDSGTFIMPKVKNLTSGGTITNYRIAIKIETANGGGGGGGRASSGFELINVAPAVESNRLGEPTLPNGGSVFGVSEDPLSGDI